LLSLWSSNTGETVLNDRVILNVIKRDNYTLVNICERETLGKTFEENNLRLVVNEEFFGGQEVGLEYAFSLINSATAVSIVGNKVVEEAIKRGFVAKEGVIEVKGIKFAQIYNLES